MIEDIQEIQEVIMPRSIPRPTGCRPVSELAMQQGTRSLGRKAAMGRTSEFIAICFKHGWTMFDTATGACLSCLVELAGTPPAYAYRTANGVLYPAECEVHGAETLHHCLSHRCSRCYSVNGRARQRNGVVTDPRRQDAKFAGKNQYIGTCEVHGETLHSTLRAKCLTCFNSLGQPRKAEWHRGPPL